MAAVVKEWDSHCREQQGLGVMGSCLPSPGSQGSEPAGNDKNLPGTLGTATGGWALLPVGSRLLQLLQPGKSVLGCAECGTGITPKSTLRAEGTQEGEWAETCTSKGDFP